jgi:hypothetical protein
MEEPLYMSLPMWWLISSRYVSKPNFFFISLFFKVVKINKKWISPSLNISYWNNMEPSHGENPNWPSSHENRPNPNTKQVNVNIEIDVGLRSLRILIQDLKNTKDHFLLLWATSLYSIVTSITNDQTYLSHVRSYKDKMFEYYSMGLDIN